MKTRRPASAWTGILMALCLLYSAPARPDTPITTLPLGTSAPAFSLPDVAGRQHTLQEYAIPGHVTVLNFWAFWCDTWKAEMPHLRSLAPLQDERGFRLVAISVDGTRLEEFKRLNPQPPPFPVLLDVGGTVSRRYAVAHVPTVVILDASGRVRYVHSGYPGNDVVLSQIRRAQSTPSTASTVSPKPHTKPSS
jgi:cytochrome c biogenesis protein CcmG/thiol:disulfide interchange protein DsbE